jgi:hypothetical protein
MMRHMMAHGPGDGKTAALRNVGGGGRCRGEGLDGAKTKPSTVRAMGGRTSPSDGRASANSGVLAAVMQAVGNARTPHS